MGEALDAARLLLAETPEQAAELAATLETANTTRRDLMRTAIAEARAAFGMPDPGQAPGQQALLDVPTVDAPAIAVAGGPDAPAMLVRGPWPVGIVGPRRGTPRRRDRPADHRRDADRRLDPGLVPGRRPGQPRRDADRLRATCSSASAATPPPPASSSPAERWDEFTARFLEAAAASAPTDARPPLAVDLALPAAYVDYTLYRDLARLAPCGTGNPEPLVAVLGLTVQRVRLANGGHTQLVLRRERDVLDGIAFGRPDLVGLLAEGDRVDIVARLASRVFGGLETLQLEVRDVSTSGSHPRAAEVLAVPPVASMARRSAPVRPCRPGRGGMHRDREPAERRRAPRARRRPHPLSGVPLAAALSIVGLLVIGVATYALGTGDIPLAGRPTTPVVRRPGRPADADPAESSSSHGAAEAQAEPIPGTFVYVKDGNVWLQTDGKAQQLTKGGDDSMPAFAPDGTAVLFVRGRQADGAVEHHGVIRNYLLDVPALMQIPVDGGNATRSSDGLVDPPGQPRSGTASSGTRACRPAADIAMRPTARTHPVSDVTLKSGDTSGQSYRPGAHRGHPARPPGSRWRRTATSRLRARGPRRREGHPRIYSYDWPPEKTKAVTGPGYLQPVVLAGRPVHRRDQDQRVRDGCRDPRRDQRAQSCSAHRRRRQLGARPGPPRATRSPTCTSRASSSTCGSPSSRAAAPTWTVKETLDLTSNAGLDGASRPDWFVPEDHLPARHATPEPSPDAGRLHRP